jgi:hypothetical protein
MAHMLSAILRPANGNNRRAWRSKGKAPSLLNVGGNERRRSTKGPRVDQDMRPKGSSEGPPFCAPRAHSPTVRRRPPLLAGGIIGSTSLGVRQNPDNAGYFDPLPGGVRVSTSVPPKKNHAPDTWGGELFAATLSRPVESASGPVSVRAHCAGSETVLWGLRLRPPDTWLHIDRQARILRSHNAELGHMRPQGIDQLVATRVMQPTPRRSARPYDAQP